MAELLSSVDVKSMYFVEVSLCKYDIISKNIASLYMLIDFVIC